MDWLQNQGQEAYLTLNPRRLMDWEACLQPLVPSSQRHWQWFLTSKVFQRWLLYSIPETEVERLFLLSQYQLFLVIRPKIPGQLKYSSSENKGCREMQDNWTHNLEALLGWFCNYSLATAEENMGFSWSSWAMAPWDQTPNWTINYYGWNFWCKKFKPLKWCMLLGTKKKVSFST